MNRIWGPICFVITIVTIFYLGDIFMASAKSQEQKHIILLGASVGKAWNINGLPDRSKNQKYSFEYVGLYRFDKSSALQEILARRENKPAAVILKECAAYIPNEVTFEQAKSLMNRWIDQCQRVGVIPIPATVTPVTHSLDEKFKTKNPAKRLVKRVLGISMKTKMEAIIEYNDWVKAYSKEKGLIVLDLETPLRTSSDGRFLREDLTKGDGLHLNAEAYRLLDGIVIPTLEKAFDKKW
jgi:hypothetical protein